MDWKIFYADRSTFSSEDGPAKSAPCDGVQVIIQPDKRTNTGCIDGKDFYVFDDGFWVGMDLPGLLCHLRQRGIVKEAVTVPNERYDAILHEALNDPDFPKRSGRRKGEPG